MPRRTLKHSTRIRLLGGLAVLVLLLSSCIKYEATVKINDDGSGTVNLLTAIDPEAFEAFGDLGDLGGTGQICDDFNSDTTSAGDAPAGAVIEPYNEDGFCGARVQYPLPASTDHSAMLADVLDESTRIYKQGDNWFFESNFSADEITGEAEDFGADVVSDLFGDASFQITIDLPGRAVGGANNASQTGDDGVFRWDIDLLNPPTRLFAQTEPGSGGGDGSGLTANSASGDGGGLSPVVIGLIVAALLGAGALFFVMNKRKKEADGPPAGDPLQPGVANPVQPGAPMGAGATMPVTDGPAILATPPGAATAAAAGAAAMRETVVLSAADAQQFASESVAETASTTPQPQYDDALGAWIVDDPARGRLRHDPATDTWNPI